MRLTLHGISAFEYWHSSLSIPSPDLQDESAFTTNTSTFGHCPPESIHDAEVRLSRFDGTHGILHVLMPDKESCRDSDLISCHVWRSGHSLPAGSIISISPSVDVVSPELALVQMAPNVTRFQLARAITDLCSRYALAFTDRSCIVQRQPATSPEQIAFFLDSVPGASGTKQVRAMLRWCLAGSRSPRETTMALYFHLPTRLGGKQLPTFELNRRLDLKGDSAILTRRSYLEGDAVWFDRRLVVEYNSDKYHDTEEEKRFDFEKITALQSMGFTVTPISTWQFNSYEKIEAIVQTLRKGLGCRTTRRNPANSEDVESTHCIRSRLAYDELLSEERRQRELPSLCDTARWRFLMSQ